MTGASRPTLVTVAAEAGVSTATVSNALNGTGRLSEATRRRVLDAARRLAYAPATATRAHARGKTGVLGLTMTTFGDAVVPYTEIPYYSQLILAAIGAAHERGYLLVVMPSTMSRWMWLTTPLDGVIHSEPRADDPVRSILLQRRIPMVSAGRPLDPSWTDAWVDNDNALATRLVLENLAAQEARRIALALPRHDDAYPMMVRDAYAAWCNERQVPELVESFDVIPDYPEAERAAVDRLLDRRPRPDAVFGIYSDSGHHILAAAASRGLPVPRRLKVACISEDPAYATTSPPITTVSLDPARIGVEAVDVLLALIGARRGLERQRIVTPLLHAR
jgi:DNA-binding LacI/PurR family transcriptional regulator